MAILWGLLTAQLQNMGLGAFYCPRMAPTRDVVSCTYEQWFRPYSLCRRHCRLPRTGLYLAGTCSLGLVAMAYLLLLVILMELPMMTELRGCACLAIVVVL